MLLLSAMLLAESASGQASDAASHRVTIRREAETTITVPKRSVIPISPGLAEHDGPGLQSNVRRLKLVFSVVEPVGLSSRKAPAVNTDDREFRQVYSTQASVRPTSSKRISLTDVIDRLPSEITRDDDPGRLLVITVTK